MGQGREAGDGGLEGRGGGEADERNVNFEVAKFPSLEI